MRIGNTEIELSPPAAGTVEWIGGEDLLEQVLACWTVVTPQDRPLCPRLVGRPGMGKTTLAQAAAQRLGRPCWIVQCTADTRPEDLVVTPVLGTGGEIRYRASGLATAVLEGGVCILDEANRMPEKSWASLAPLLDHRRYLDSLVAGVRLEAHEGFRCCVTMNEDASTFEVPEYILSRIQPQIELRYPDPEEELQILQYHVDFAPESLLRMTADFLQESHRHRLDYSTRDGVHILRYAIRLHRVLGEDLEDAFHRAVAQVLGPDAEDFEKRKAALIDDRFTDFGELFGLEGLEEDDEEEEDAAG